MASLVWNIHDHEYNTNRILIDRGRSLFNMVLMHRRWNSEHGGVYVPITESSQPNPFLVDPVRELTCTGGVELTKVNPEYMTRQVSELLGNDSKTHFHITSLAPMRPGNRADEWESNALRSFEQGARESFELVGGDKSKGNYRYMAPLVTEQRCLKCHAEQGYRVGDIRGGISISFDADEIHAAYGGHLSHMTIVHSAALLMGVVFIFWFAGYSRKADRTIDEEKSRFRELVELTDAVHWEVDISTLNFTYISPNVEDLLGYPAGEWKDFDFWVSTLHPEDRQWAPAYCNEKTAKSEDHIFSYRSAAADGRTVWIRDIVNVVTDEAGRPVKLRGLFLDDTEIKKAESELKRSLNEKDVLLREVHHRVKNNMSVIISLQNLQAGRMEDGVAREALLENMRRVRSMALVHEMIYQGDNMASIDVSEYLKSLAEYVAGVYGFSKSGIEIDVELGGAQLDLDTLIPLGLLVNELISNSMKHAFDGSSDGSSEPEIWISLISDGKGHVELVAGDNGRGLPADVSLDDTRSLGLRLVKALADQLSGRLEIRRQGGTTFIIRFPDTSK